MQKHLIHNTKHIANTLEECQILHNVLYFQLALPSTYTCNRQCFNEVTIDKTIPKIISIQELVQTELCDDNSHNTYDLPSLTIGKRFPARYKGLAFPVHKLTKQSDSKSIQSSESTYWQQ